MTMITTRSGSRSKHVSADTINAARAGPGYRVPARDFWGQDTGHREWPLWRSDHRAPHGGGERPRHSDGWDQGLAGGMARGCLGGGKPDVEQHEAASESETGVGRKRPREAGGGERMLLRTTSTEALPYHHQPDGSAVDPTRLDVTCEWVSILPDWQQASAVHRTWSRRPSPQNQRTRIHSTGCTQQGGAGVSGGDREGANACSDLNGESPARTPGSMVASPDLKDRSLQQVVTVSENNRNRKPHDGASTTPAPRGSCSRLGKRKPQGGHGPPRTRRRERRDQWARSQRPTAAALQAVYFSVAWVAVEAIAGTHAANEEQHEGESEQQPAPTPTPRSAGGRARGPRPQGRGSLGRGGG